jgi:dihydrofolate reductase
MAARISVTMSTTLDGVVQGLGRPDEDTRGGFPHGGWGDGFADHVQGAFMAEGMSASGAMLFGHRTYVDLLTHWTAVTEPNPFTGYLTQVRKYVVSRDPSTALGFPESVLLAGEAAETVARLKDEVEGDLSVIGSGALVRSLHAAGLVDEYTLLVHPIVLGSGTRLFGEGDRTDLELTRSVTTTTGVVIAQYAVRH